ncbi:hypothetical protein BXZ70DRAFT_964740, partial [Cristinia sonorae]
TRYHGQGGLGQAERTVRGQRQANYCFSHRRVVPQHTVRRIPTGTAAQRYAAQGSHPCITRPIPRRLPSGRSHGHLPSPFLFDNPHHSHVDPRPPLDGPGHLPTPHRGEVSTRTHGSCLCCESERLSLEGHEREEGEEDGEVHVRELQEARSYEGGVPEVEGRQRGEGEGHSGEAQGARCQGCYNRRTGAGYFPAPLHGKGAFQGAEHAVPVDRGLRRIRDHEFATGVVLPLSTTAEPSQGSSRRRTAHPRHRQGSHHAQDPWRQHEAGSHQRRLPRTGTQRESLLGVPVHRQRWIRQLRRHPLPTHERRQLRHCPRRTP